MHSKVSERGDAYVHTVGVWWRLHISVLDLSHKKGTSDTIMADVCAYVLVWEVHSNILNINTQSTQDDHRA